MLAALTQLSEAITGSTAPEGATTAAPLLLTAPDGTTKAVHWQDCRPAEAARGPARAAAPAAAFDSEKENLKVQVQQLQVRCRGCSMATLF